VTQLTFDDGGYSGITLAEAREQLFAELRDGTTCPCCDQHAQEYRWSLYRRAIRMLERLYQIGGTDHYVESKRAKAPGDGGSFSHLRLWDLVVQENERRPDGGKSGYWRVTPLGEQFLRRQTRVPKYAWVYNGELLRREGEMLWITDIVDDFDWRQHMGGS
jgi:hypothetical protein